MKAINFYNQNADFIMEQPDRNRSLFFPIASEKGLKSVVTPLLGGDSKLSQNAFLMEPVSIENLHNNRSGRNFWCLLNQAVDWSAVGQSSESESLRITKDAEKNQMTAGFMWQKIQRTSQDEQLKSEILSFVPYDENVEMMHVKITNIGNKKCSVVPTGAIPIYGRSADNLRDHRHVTSLLHRIRTEKYGVLVRPTLSFDERGHQKNTLTYFVCGVTGDGQAPREFYPSVDSFLGEGGTYTCPEAVMMNNPGVSAGVTVAGVEAFGGLRFQEQEINPGQSVDFTIFIGVTEDATSIDTLVETYRSSEKVLESYEKTVSYWQNQVNVWFHTKNPDFDGYMRWVGFQPFLRRIYGCSFLPYHDYGKGGRGWRDLWQDCLALLMMNPSGVRTMILDNFAGVRLDGSNATIIGEKQGEFIADRNHITRVWMDHGVWPWKTTCLYLEQTGDLELLNVLVPYFKDQQIARGTKKDWEWKQGETCFQKDKNQQVLLGSVLEHLLIQNVCAFYEVGEHNHMRIRGADWNDALDMAEERGESVAFTCAYAGNLTELANYLRELTKKGQSTVLLMEELRPLFEFSKEDYDNIQKKTSCLDAYMDSCGHTVSGEKHSFSVEELADNLEEKAQWIMNHIRETEWIEESKESGWFNSYYDNHGQAVEGIFPNQVRMMLTGQVFSIMSRVAEVGQVKKIYQAAVKHLFVKETGGFRINTDFQEEKYDLGRMFGFAYGTKENGAVFSHMTVMFANALYQRGFVKEGYLALSTLFETSMNFNTSKMYPGIPEYFDANGRGMYQYLTGAASWYLLTMITEVFGVKGRMGDLLFEPKLLLEQFDEQGVASIELLFAGKKILVQYRNKKNLDYGDYRIQKLQMNHAEYPILPETKAIIPRDVVISSTAEKQIIEIELG